MHAHKHTHTHNTTQTTHTTHTHTYTQAHTHTHTHTHTYSHTTVFLVYTGVARAKIPAKEIEIDGFFRRLYYSTAETLPHTAMFWDGDVDSHDGASPEEARARIIEQIIDVASLGPLQQEELRGPQGMAKRFLPPGTFWECTEVSFWFCRGPVNHADASRNNTRWVLPTLLRYATRRHIAVPCWGPHRDGSRIQPEVSTTNTKSLIGFRAPAFIELTQHAIPRQIVGSFFRIHGIVLPPWPCSRWTITFPEGLEEGMAQSDGVPQAVNTCVV
jgi:hypothetical protein